MIPHTEERQQDGQRPILHSNGKPRCLAKLKWDDHASSDNDQLRVYNEEEEESKDAPPIFGQINVDLLDREADEESKNFHLDQSDGEVNMTEVARVDGPIQDQRAVHELQIQPENSEDETQRVEHKHTGIGQTIEKLAPPPNMGAAASLPS